MWKLMLNQILDDKENHFRADIDKMPRLHSNNTNSNCEGTKEKNIN